MPLNFDKHATKGKLFLSQLSVDLGDGMDTDQAGRILKSVMHALRNHLTLEENFQLLAQLPMALKGLYVDGWSPMKGRFIGRKKVDFLNEVMLSDGQNATVDFPSLRYTEHAVTTVFSTLRKYVSDGEMEDIRAVLPREIKSLILLEK